MTSAPGATDSKFSCVGQLDQPVARVQGREATDGLIAVMAAKGQPVDPVFRERLACPRIIP